MPSPNLMFTEVKMIFRPFVSILKGWKTNIHIIDRCLHGWKNKQNIVNRIPVTACNCANHIWSTMHQSWYSIRIIYSDIMIWRSESIAAHWRTEYNNLFNYIKEFYGKLFTGSHTFQPITEWKRLLHAYLAMFTISERPLLLWRRRRFPSNLWVHCRHVFLDQPSLQTRIFNVGPSTVGRRVVCGKPKNEQSWYETQPLLCTPFCCRLSSRACPRSGTWKSNLVPRPF